MTEKEVAIVVGAGPGLGNALVARFAEAGMTVAAVSRRGIAPKLPCRGIGTRRASACELGSGDRANAGRGTSTLDPSLLLVNRSRREYVSERDA